MTVQANPGQVKNQQPLGRLLRQSRPGLGLWRKLSVLGLVIVLWGGYAVSGWPLTLVVNGQPYRLRTHQSTVAGAIQELGLDLGDQDVVEPGPAARLVPGATVSLQLARPVSVEADGRNYRILTQGATVADVLRQAGVLMNPRDEVLIDGKVVGTGYSPVLLPRPVPPSPSSNAARRLLSAFTPRGALVSARPEPVQLVIHRAVPVTLHDNQVSSNFYTTRPNVGEALLEQGITLFLGDKVTPNLGAPLSPGLHLYIQRSTPVTVRVDGRLIKTRTHRKTVGQVLAQEGVALMGQDFSRPPASALIAADDAIEVVRVQQAVEVEEVFIPFESTWIADEEMELDRHEVRQQGQTGVIKSRYRVRYENGQEVWRGLEDEWLDREASQRIIAYGTRIVVRTLNTPDGPIEYWRRIPMLATPYSAATSGKTPDNPHYGITRSGLQVRYGMAAVDPKVVPLMTELYVPGYGRALAADTGGLILGKHIDLAYEEDQPMPDMYGWVDVYVLTPVPPAARIRYVLPEWPQRGD